MSHTLFRMALEASLALCALGLLWRASVWFRLRIGPDLGAVTLAQRFRTLFRGTAAALLTGRVRRVLAMAFYDILLQRRLYASDWPRWLGHALMMLGFIALLLMHALAAVVTVKLFPGYEPTRSPYLFLRNLFGAMVVVGLVVFLYERWRRRAEFAAERRPRAAAFVTLLGMVLASGFLLEADKIASPQAFYRMAKDYAGSTDPVELRPLRAIWASEFGVAFDDLGEPLLAAEMAQGREMHEENCASCHARPASAFVSYPIALALAPALDRLDAARADVWLVYLHVFACLLGLATLPFTRFFHAVAVPVSLLVNCTAPNREFSAPGRALRRALALDACVRCGLCDVRCSVAPLAHYLQNPFLLPSQKLIATDEFAHGGAKSDALRVAEGAFLCTDCGRCTSACPAGLDLEDLWQATRGDLAAVGLQAPAQWVQARPAMAWAEALTPAEAMAGSHDTTDASRAPLSADRRSFSRCVQCQTCTNVCPVVAHSTGTAAGLDLTPQKVMNLLRLGLRDLTLGSRMVWNCATCYQCQEHCPEGIRVTDIMCELRALAVHRLGAARHLETPS